ncbi:MAG: TolC family protein [Gemmatimonadetes bacterium]|nr:TolC family protein [Gemmatimonadota bacterium]
MRPSVLMLALASLASAASAQQPSSHATDTLRLSRRQAVASALLANPQLDVAREQTAQVRAQRVEGLGIPDPSLSASFDSLSALRNVGSAPMRPVSLGITVPFPDKLRLRNRIGLENIKSSESAFRLQQQTIASAAGRAYDSVLVTRQHRRDLLEARDLANAFLKRAQARFNAGSVPKLDVIKAQVDVAQSENDLIANSRDVANADAALNRVLGRPLALPLAPTDSIATPAPLPDLDAVEQVALRVRPEITSLEAQLRGAQANVTLVRESAIAPDIVMGAFRDMAADPLFTYQIGISMPLPLFYPLHTKGDFAESRHRVLELAATLRDARAGVGQDVRAAWATADAALRQAVFIRDQLLRPLGARGARCAPRPARRAAPVCRCPRRRQLGAVRPRACRRRAARYHPWSTT